MLLFENHIYLNHLFETPWQSRGISGLNILNLLMRDTILDIPNCRYSESIIDTRSVKQQEFQTQSRNAPKGSSAKNEQKSLKTINKMR